MGINLQKNCYTTDSARINAIQNKNILLETDIANKEKLIQSLDAIAKNVYDKANAFKKIASPEAQVITDKFLAEFEKIRGIYREMNELAKEGKMNEIAKIARERESQTRGEMNKHLFDLHALTAADLEKASKDADKAYELAKNTRGWR